MKRIKLDPNESIKATIRVDNFIFPMKFEILDKQCKSTIYVGFDFKPESGSFTLRLEDQTSHYFEQRVDKPIYRNIHFLIEAKESMDTLMGCAFKNLKRNESRLKESNLKQKEQIKSSSNVLKNGIDIDKYDLFCERELEKRKRMAKAPTNAETLRFNQDVVGLDNYMLLLTKKKHEQHLKLYSRTMQVRYKRGQLLEARKEKALQGMNRNIHYKKQRFDESCVLLSSLVDESRAYFWFKFIKFVIYLQRIRDHLQKLINSRRRRFKMLRLSNLLYSFIVPLKRNKRTFEQGMTINIKL